MPLFEWSSSTSTSSTGTTGKFWIYWATTVPATVLVLVIWRAWYVFDEWRQSHGTRASIQKDIRAWVNSWWLGARKDADLESGKDS
jgi:hypothetical protein